jgi:hypothetical protein
MCPYEGHPGTIGLSGEKGIDSMVFVTAGRDSAIKVWELYEDMVRLLYVITLPASPDVVTCMCSYEMERYKDSLICFVESRHFYIV